VLRFWEGRGAKGIFVERMKTKKNRGGGGEEERGGGGE